MPDPTPDARRALTRRERWRYGSLVVGFMFLVFLAWSVAYAAWGVLAFACCLLSSFAALAWFAVLFYVGQVE